MQLRALAGRDRPFSILPAPWHWRAQTDIRTGVFWNEVASGFIAGLVARHTLEFERRTRGVLGKDVLTRLRDYVIAHIDEPIEVSTLEDSGAQPVPFYPVAHPIRWRQSAPRRRAFAMATSGRACSSCPIRLGRCRGAHRLCPTRPSHALGPARPRRFPDGTGRLSPKSRNLQDQRLPFS